MESTEIKGKGRLETGDHNFSEALNLTGPSHPEGGRPHIYLLSADLVLFVKFVPCCK